MTENNYYEKSELSLGINILSYSVEILLFNITAGKELAYIKEELPDGYDPLPFTAGLIKDNINSDSLEKVSCIGAAFPGKIEANRQYTAQSDVFPEYYERSFTKELMLILKLEKIRSYILSYTECEKFYINHTMNISGTFLLLFLKQGISGYLSEANDWHKSFNWNQIGHLNTGCSKLCLCGKKGCLQCEAGDIQCALKFKNKISFKHHDITDFKEALKCKNSDAEKILEESVKKILNTLNLQENFRTLPDTIMFSSDIPEVSYEILNRTVNEIYNNRIKAVLLPARSTVTGAALIPKNSGQKL
jgi:predicted NBD/HSP70 family sugar kinase